jgi:hypothetical protein
VVKVMMAAVSVITVRYRWTLFPALAFLAFVAYRIHSVASTAKESSMDMVSPFLIGIGLIIMHQSQAQWFSFWIGESIVIGMFTYNSVSAAQKSTALFCAVAIFSALSALFFRGKFWNYALVIGLELFLALFIALSFPVMEMVLEAILNDKLRKVGDKIRSHHSHMERYYNAQQKQKR